MKNRFYLSTVGKVLNWSLANSFSYIVTGSCCCETEMLETAGARYDIERFGCLPELDPRQADLLVVTGVVTYKSAPFLRGLYDQMAFPKYVLAIGACTSCGGKFAPDFSYSVLPGLDRIIPVDVYVPGCPPRPEAIMNGLIALQEKIRGYEQTKAKN